MAQSFSKAYWSVIDKIGIHPATQKGTIAEGEKSLRQKEYTEQVAYELYQNRLLLGRKGTPQNDWETAEKIVESPLKTTLFASNRPLIKLRAPIIKFENPIPRPSLKLEWAKIIGLLTLLTTVTSIAIGVGNQRESYQNNLIKEYFEHLENLSIQMNLMTDDRKAGAVELARGRTVVLLRELDLAKKKQLMAYLRSSSLITDKKCENGEPIISFRQQDLSDMDLRELKLNCLDLSGTDLSRADLRRTDLRGTDLRGASLTGTQLTGVITDDETKLDIDRNLFFRLVKEEGKWRDFSGEDFSGANLAGTNLSNANFSNANFSSAILAGAQLVGSNLQHSGQFCRRVGEKLSTA
jgi:uncharacterized protein YjbI with pentapeptide repeats